jgi:hypothetical protein
VFWKKKVSTPTERRYALGYYRRADGSPSATPTPDCRFIVLVDDLSYSAAVAKLRSWEVFHEGDPEAPEPRIMVALDLPAPIVMMKWE